MFVCKIKYRLEHTFNVLVFVSLKMINLSKIFGFFSDIITFIFSLTAVWYLKYVYMKILYRVYI